MTFTQSYRVFYDREDSSILWLCMSSDDSETLIRQYNSQRRREASDFYIYKEDMILEIDSIMIIITRTC